MDAKEKRLEIEERLRHFVSDNAVLKADAEFAAADVQRRLIDCLVDGSVLSVVESLSHLQDLKETQLLSQRYNRVRELGGRPDDEQIREIDRQIIGQLDEMVAEQQSNLGCAGVPLFRVTDEPAAVKTQLEIVKFILTLQNLF
ncbi:hypothetical protein M3Y99_01061900 [Aphelenchoides fujianensis]|nr:hypothetical protein M3Y99_01061900 [Aphelenchoides fujianensis]